MASQQIVRLAAELRDGDEIRVGDSFALVQEKTLTEEGVVVMVLLPLNANITTSIRPREELFHADE